MGNQGGPPAAPGKASQERERKSRRRMACDECHGSKVKCTMDLEAGCKRCRKLGHRCVYEMYDATGRVSAQRHTAWTPPGWVTPAANNALPPPPPPPAQDLCAGQPLQLAAPAQDLAWDEPIFAPPPDQDFYAEQQFLQQAAYDQYPAWEQQLFVPVPDIEQPSLEQQLFAPAPATALYAEQSLQRAAYPQDLNWGAPIHPLAAAAPLGQFSLAGGPALSYGPSPDTITPYRGPKTPTELDRPFNTPEMQEAFAEAFPAHEIQPLEWEPNGAVMGGYGAGQQVAPAQGGAAWDPDAAKAMGAEVYDSVEVMFSARFRGG